MDHRERERALSTNRRMWVGVPRVLSCILISVMYIDLILSIMMHRSLSIINQSTESALNLRLKITLTRSTLVDRWHVKLWRWLFLHCLVLSNFGIVFRLLSNCQQSMRLNAIRILLA